MKGAIANRTIIAAYASTLDAEEAIDRVPAFVSVDRDCLWLWKGCPLTRILHVQQDEGLGKWG